MPASFPGRVGLLKDVSSSEARMCTSEQHHKARPAPAVLTCELEATEATAKKSATRNT